MIDRICVNSSESRFDCAVATWTRIDKVPVLKGKCLTALLSVQLQCQFSINSVIWHCISEGTQERIGRANIPTTICYYRHYCCHRIYHHHGNSYAGDDENDFDKGRRRNGPIIMRAGPWRAVES